jgi:hypothetical protein
MSLMGVLWNAGFPRKYAERYDPERTFADGPSARALEEWLTGFAEALDRGTWLLLLGGVGCGKSMAMARVAAMAARMVPGLEPCYRTAEELGFDLVEWDRAREAVPIDMERALRSRLLLVDDIDRWLLMSPHDIDRGRMLYRWDVMTELRDAPGKATVVACNRTAQQLQEEPAFVRWYDRAAGSGLVLEIPGLSQRRLEVSI